MSLSSNHLDAFAEVAKQKSFSLAAKKLNITQSALSQRVMNLEQDIGSTLFIRAPAGIRLTELGQKLLRYCHSRELLEIEFLTGIQSQNHQAMKGIVRIAAFSTVTRSVLVPIMADFFKTHPEIQFELRSEELRALPSLLTNGSTDFILTTHPIDKQGVENRQVGYEENVLVIADAKSAREDICLDHDEDDMTTFDFFKHQGRKLPSLGRSYLDEIYSIIEGVRLGMGCAVIPIHLARVSKGITVVDGYKSLKIPVYLCYYSQTFYTDLQKRVIDQVITEAPKYLSFR